MILDTSITMKKCFLMEKFKKKYKKISILPIFCLLSSNNESILTRFQQQAILVDKWAPYTQILEKYSPKKPKKWCFLAFFINF